MFGDRDRSAGKEHMNERSERGSERSERESM